MNIYGYNLLFLAFSTVLVLCVWFLILLHFERRKNSTVRLRQAVIIVIPLVIYWILKFTVLFRVSNGEHLISFIASYSSEFYRELFMNTLLFIPLGMTLSVCYGLRVIPIGFVISLSIEAWQYFAGTGLAQGTDVLMNTLGTAIGAIPWFVVRWIVKRRGKKQYST